eukprot:jgi/Orpsp1_1/1180549/evm.model.c7180000073845.1
MKIKNNFLIFLASLTAVNFVYADDQCDIIREVLNVVTDNKFDYTPYQNIPMGCCNINFIGCKSIDTSKSISAIKFDGNAIPLNNEVPKLLTQLTDIEGFIITNCQNKTFSIPDFLSSFPKLNTFELIDSTISKKIPDDIGNIKTLERITFHKDYIEGSIPENIGSLKNLKAIYLDENIFSGSIPESIGNLKKLEVLNLQNNLINGNIPSSISKLSNLEVLVLSGNNLSGEIPEDIGNLSKLTELDLSLNRLEGSLPQSMEKLKNLKKVGLFGVLPNFSSNVTTCTYSSSHFCTEIKPDCARENIPCTEEMYKKVKEFKENEKNKKSKLGYSASQYIIALIIILIPLVGIAIFLRVYKWYSLKKDDEILIKQIDRINTKNDYFNSDFQVKDINSDTDSDANMLISRTPDHRKLHSENSQRSIFNDYEEDIDEYEK